MQIVALLRGVTPIGKNKIPKMSYLAQIIKEADFENVQTYIQSGNILLNTNLTYEETAIKIHDVIYEKIGADLSVIIKNKAEFESAIKDNPFDDSYDYSRIHVVFTNSLIDENKLKKVQMIKFDGEIFKISKECFYMYLPRDAQKKKLNNNFLEKQVDIIATTRKLNVVQHLCDKMD